MTPLDLQTELIAEMQALFADQLFHQPREKITEPDVMVPMTWYQQMLPMQDGYKWDKYVPYGVVQLKKAEHQQEDEPMDVTAILIFCTFNDSKDNTESMAILNAIEKVRQDLFTKRILAGKYSVRLPFRWQMEDEEVWPYFVGGVETHWALPIIAPEDPNL